MKLESIVFGVTGTLFGFLLGWVLGTQQGTGPRAVSTAAPVAQAAPAGVAPATRPVIDETHARNLQTIAERDATNVPSRVDLGNLYFDGERYADAIKWYEQALKLAPRDVNVSTDLAVSYYYIGQVDQSLKQFEYSLGVDPKHLKTLLNQGIVRAFGKQDLKGAMASWDEVLRLAPDSQEGASARRALENLKSAHPGGTPVPPAGTPPAGAASPAPGRIGG
jgi:cytochrome c-type biogenesis protein CcmH/NrfG